MADRLEEKIDDIKAMAQRNDRALRGSNGDVGVVAEVKEIGKAVQDIKGTVESLHELVQAQSETIGGLASKSDVSDLRDRTKDLEEYKQDHPSLLWLLRFRTKEAITVILTMFFLLSLLFISDLRHPIMSFLGIPIP